MASYQKLKDEHTRAKLERSGAIATVRPPANAYEWVSGPFVNERRTGQFINANGSDYFVMQNTTNEGYPSSVVIAGAVLGQEWNHDGRHRTVTVRPVGSRAEENLVSKVVQDEGLKGHIAFW